ncbi:MAG: serine hydrolase, partial [Candidatus Zixiibacteriota bacterium]
IKNGYLVAERYFNDAYVDMAPSVASVTKSFTSALTGLALRDGHLISLDQKMVDFFPELDWAGTDLRKGDITIRQMLQMRSGYPAEAVGGYLDELMAYDFDWIPVLIDFPLTNEPGTAFGYSSLTSHMLAVILARASGTDLYTFARINLLDPLECGQVYWPADLRGYYVGHGDVCMRPRDMAKFGLLYLNGGVYKGTQIIPADWVTESLTPYSHDVYGGDPLDYMTNISYGYLWWTAEAGGHGIKLARGFGGQLIVIVPDLDMVVVTSALITNLWDPESSTRSKAIQEMVGKFISSQ